MQPKSPCYYMVNKTKAAMDDIIDLTGEISSDEMEAADRGKIVRAKIPTIDLTVGDNPPVRGAIQDRLVPKEEECTGLGQVKTADFFAKKAPIALPSSRIGMSPTVGPSPRKAKMCVGRESIKPMPTSSSNDKVIGLNPPLKPLKDPLKDQHRGRSKSPETIDWTVEMLTARLKDYAAMVKQDHSDLVIYCLEEAAKKAPEHGHRSEFDCFADMSLPPLQGQPAGVETMVMKFKQHSGESSKSKTTAKRNLFPVVCIMTDKEAVPKYRFHHVEIQKNILAPNTMLKFVPHLRDVEQGSAEEKKYHNWLTELQKLDSQSGFQTEEREHKINKRIREEQAATLSTYLDDWISALNVDGCTKASLTRLMANEQDDGGSTPQKRISVMSHQEPCRMGDGQGEEAGSRSATQGAKLFSQAFDRVFDDKRKQDRVSLREVLRLNRSGESLADNKRAKDTPTSQKGQDSDLMSRVQQSLASYSYLQCLVCFSYDCEHGDFDNDNLRGAFSLEFVGGLKFFLERKYGEQLAQANSQLPTVGMEKTLKPCRNNCFREYDTGNMYFPVKSWEANHVTMLENVFATMGYSTTLRPQCFVAAVLGRKCSDVYKKLKELKLELPPAEQRGDRARVKPVPWYDRKKKALLGDWQAETVSHEHSIREIMEPCHHKGPCTPQNGCPCARIHSGHALLCERFCQCTVETCALKFTGCACHSRGKTCIQRQREGKACICVQLNRECDPLLCLGCGARDRADPQNAHDEFLHSTGCQNVPLQRGAVKAVVLGKSQLDGCGYGLFTAEDISQDDLVIEYMGELITHDEGVRREARRGDVFDEESTSSYLFTLLEHEGIWVDAAIYGNLSRYINHASGKDDRDRKGCNITPKIVYINHEYRIRFTALRDIKAGEELFFNYGDNFPNLTKKLLEQDEEAEAGAKPRRKPGPKPGTARKSMSSTTGHGARKVAPDLVSSSDVEDDHWVWMDDFPPIREDEDDGVWEDTAYHKKKAAREPKKSAMGRRKRQAAQNAEPDREEEEHHAVQPAHTIYNQDENDSAGEIAARRPSTACPSPLADHEDGTASFSERPIVRGMTRPPVAVDRTKHPGHPEPRATSTGTASITARKTTVANTTTRCRRDSNDEHKPASRGQKRKAADMTAGHGRAATPEPKSTLSQGRSQPSPRSEEQDDEQGDGEDDEDDDDDADDDDADDDDEPIDRTRRRRRPPARYREGEE